MAKEAVGEGEGTGKFRFVVGKMATQWKNFKTAMKEKRTGKRKAPSYDIIQKEKIVIQRLSTEVSGKAQKYSCISLQEFMPFDYEEVTLDNILKERV